MSSPAEEEERPPVPPTADRVVRRALCLSAVTCRSFLDGDSTVEECQSLNNRLRPWLAASGAEAELEEWEVAARVTPLGHLDPQTRINGGWASEGLVVLAWALRRYDLPPHVTMVDPQALTSALEFLSPGAAMLPSSASLRPADEIQTGAERAFALHWRVRDFTLKGNSMNFADFARTAWFGPLNIEGVALAESDLAVGGVPISRATDEAIQTVSSIALERHRAFNWLLGHEEIYSEVSTST